jgi:hypothetical protein
VSSHIEILLVSGLHPNEACAPLMARKVFKRLSNRGARVAHCEIPYPYTLLALIDDPAAAVTDYSMPVGERRLDVDLDGIDELLQRQYPGAVIFEFHNSEDMQPLLGLNPGEPPREYQVGEMDSESKRPQGIAT